MARELKIKIADHDGNNEEVVDLSFSDRDWKVMQDFVKYAAELQEDSSLVKDGMPISLNVKWSEKEGFKSEAKLPPKEPMYAMFELLRPFILKDERTNFNRVRNIVKRATTSKKVKDYLETLKVIYSGRRLQSIFVVGTSSPDYPDPKIVNSEDMLELYLNAFRYHKDEDKQAHFDALHKISPPESSLALLLFLVQDKIDAIRGLQQIIELFVGKLEKIYAQFILPEPLHYLLYLHASVVSFSFLDNEGEEKRPLPEEKPPFERVIDLTHLGSASFTQFLDLVGRMWMHNELLADIGVRHYLFRVSKGFMLPGGQVHENETDIYTVLKLQALVREEPLSADRRQPVEATLERMRMDREGKIYRKVFLKPFDTAEALGAFLDVDPKPVTEWIVVPRIAYEFAYWPASEQAKERAKKIIAEGRKPTFEEVEGDISRAWEVFEDNEEKT